MVDGEKGSTKVFKIRPGSIFGQTRFAKPSSISKEPSLGDDSDGVQDGPDQFLYQLASQVGSPRRISQNEHLLISTESSPGLCQVAKRSPSRSMSAIEGEHSRRRARQLGRCRQIDAQPCRQACGFSGVFERSSTWTCGSHCVVSSLHDRAIFTGRHYLPSQRGCPIGTAVNISDGESKQEQVSR